MDENISAFMYGFDLIVFASLNLYASLVGCFGLNGPLSISVYIGPSPREREKEKRNDGQGKNVQTTPTLTYCKHSRPLP